ncbi:Dabb family protein [Microbacterium sp. LWS13-1.2]|uniref:Dabb family protein n=1 Tax=Microbacterium sp. LWS13-1.2 TaxID=3135264 RepID=A0AAU6SBL7_9MICO
MLEHIVVVDAGDLPRPPLEAALDRFAHGIRGCRGLISISWGQNFNPLGLERRCHYVCTVILESEETLRTHYWEHPAHQILLAELPGLCESRFALDYFIDEDAAHAR